MRRSILTLLVLITGSALQAQTTDLERGVMLRAYSPTHGGSIRLEGRFVRLAADSLVLWSPAMARSGDRAIAVGQINRLERGTPRSPLGGAGRGALWGALGGGIAGAALGAAAETDSEGMLIGSAILGGAGVVVGSLIGGAWPGTRWEPIPLPWESSP